jgi:hypothetical protein
MNIEESIQQIETLIEAWQLDEADLNQTDINAMQTLLKENQELKKQLEERNIEYFKGVYNTHDKYYTQQKEFIKYLEEKEKQFDGADPRLAGACSGILQKYKRIIGVSDEKK